MKYLRLFAAIFFAVLLMGAGNVGPIAASRLRSGGGGGPTYNAETNTWISKVNAASGTYAVDSKSIADALIVALQAKSYNSKIVYLLPLLGSNLAAARVPLRDTLAVGIATNHSFVDGDFSQATGLQGNGSSKYLDSLIKPSQLGTSNSGGIGWYENNGSFGSNSESIGCYNTAGDQRYVLDLRATRHFFSWGNAGNIANETASSSNGNYYGNRSSATSRKIYFNGSLLDTNTPSETASGAGDRDIIICGADEAGTIVPYLGRCACAYMTDGTMSDSDVADFHTFLGTYLITPTGR